MRKLLPEPVDLVGVFLAGLGVLVLELVDHLFDVVELVDLCVHCGRASTVNHHPLNVNFGEK